MARFLIVTMPVPGHVAPFAPVVRRLTDAGHEVVWYTSHHYQKAVERTGAVLAPLRSALDFGDGEFDVHFPERQKHKGLAQVRFDFKHAFIDSAEGMLKDLREICAEFRPDAVVTDPTVVAGKILSLQDGIPWAMLNITVAAYPGADVAPFGLGLPPDASPLGRLRNRALNFLSDRVIFGDVHRYYYAKARANGWPLFPFRMDPSPYLTLQPSVPEFEYPRADLPPQVHFIGPLLPESPAVFEKAEWWDEVAGSRPDVRPVVLVTQGTVAMRLNELLLPTLEALRDEDVLVVAATGGAGAADLQAMQGGRPLPGNARVVPFVPFAALMPHVGAFVTNGGYGGVTIALANGVPVVAGGTTEDKMEVGGRLAYSGAGINLRTATPAPEKVRAAVRAVLGEPSYRASARRIQESMARQDGPANAVRLLERLAATGRPVS